MVLHLAFRARYVRNTGIGGEVRHGVTSGCFVRDIFKQTCNTSPPQGVHLSGKPPTRASIGGHVHDCYFAVYLRALCKIHIYICPGSCLSVITSSMVITIHATTSTRYHGYNTRPAPPSGGTSTTTTSSNYHLQKTGKLPSAPPSGGTSSCLAV